MEISYLMRPSMRVLIKVELDGNHHSIAVSQIRDDVQTRHKLSS